MNGAKNLLYIQNGRQELSSNSSVTVIDGTLTYNSTTSDTTAKTLTTITLNAGTYVMMNRQVKPSPSSGSVLGDVRLQSGNTNITSDEPATFTLDTAQTLKVTAMTYSSAISNMSIKPMIITKAVYDAGFRDYQSYALSNATITPALSECVDSGVKNKLDWASATYLSSNNCTYSKTDTSLTVSAGSSTSESKVFYSVGTFAAGNYVFKFKISSATISQQAIIYISTSTQASTSIASVQITADGTYELPFQWSGGIVYLKFFPNTTNISSSNTFTVSDLMLCTKAAFGVSSKFVPYRPNWDLVCNNLDFYTPIIKRSINTNVTGSYTLISACTLALKPSKDASGTVIDAPVYRITGFLENGTVGVRGIILSRSNDASDFDTLANIYCKAEQDSAGLLSLTCNAVAYNNDTSSSTAYKYVYCWVKGAGTGTGRVYTIAERLG